jgi:chaperonin GroEL
MDHDELARYTIILKDCRWPIRCIADNAGKDGRMVWEKVVEMQAAMGYNAQSDSYEDLIETGVIDPTKVVLSEVENAASVAALLLTTQALLAQKRQRRANSAMVSPEASVFPIAISRRQRARPLWKFND